MTDRKGNMADNTIQRYPPEVQTAMKALSKLNSKIKKHEE